MRHDRETIKAKLEWEGDVGIEWFEPDEVPEDLEDLWSRVREAWFTYQGLSDELNSELWDD